MLGKLLRELLFTGLTLLCVAGAVFVFDQATERTLDPGLPLAALEGLDRRWALAAIGVLLAGALLVFYRKPPTARGARSGCAPWILALAVVAGCACAIAALYLAPDTIQLGDSLVLRRMPRDEFLRTLAWGGAVIGGGHVLLFLVLALSTRRRSRRG